MSRVCANATLVDNLCEIMENLLVVLSGCTSSRQQATANEHLVTLSKLLRKCELTDHPSIKSSMRSLIKQMPPVSHSVVLKVLLRCRYALSDECLADMPEGRTLRRDFPISPCVLFYAMRAPRVPRLRHTLWRLGSEHWDMFQFMNYVGKDVVLEKCNIRNRYQTMPLGFAFSADSYILWPLALLRRKLSSRNFLLACFAMSEDLYVSTTFNLNGRKNTAVTAELVSYIGRTPPDEPQWWERGSTWLRRYMQRCLAYGDCMQINCTGHIGVNIIAHRELRERRASVLSKLSNQGGEYMHLWILFWMDVLHNLSYNSWTSREVEIMRRCETHMRSSSRLIGHWVLFLVAASKVRPSTYGCAPLEAVLSYVDECSERVAHPSSLRCRVAYELASKQVNSPTYLNAHFQDIQMHLSPDRNSYV